MINLNEEPWFISKKNSLKYAKLTSRKNGCHQKFAITFWSYGIFKISAFGHGSKKLKTNLSGSTFIGMECVCLACVDSAMGRVFEEDLQIETIEAQTWSAEIQEIKERYIAIEILRLRHPGEKLQGVATVISRNHISLNRQNRTSTSN